MNNEERAQRLIREIPGIAAVDAQGTRSGPDSPPFTRAEGPTIVERLEHLPWEYIWFGQPRDSSRFVVTGDDIPEEFKGLEGLRTEEYDYEFQLCGTVLVRYERRKEVEHK